MTSEDVQQLELHAALDRLRNKVQVWSSIPLHWEPALQCQSLMARVLSRVENLQIRCEAPLVVATLGGTGTGKSTLVNALVGREVTRSGRERPTTHKPQLIVHPDTELQYLDLPLEQVDLVRCDAPVLRNLILLDCPDPDTNEGAEVDNNLDRLRKLLPHCDVLLVVSTQQKYRSSRVADELTRAAAGCQLICVQTHADLDEDIRSDWRSLLAEQFHVPELFFVDSQRALQEQQRGVYPSGEMGRLLDFLQTQFGAAQRLRIRRANVLDLLRDGLLRCESTITEHRSGLDQLQSALDIQREQLSQKMAKQLQHDLQSSRGLWERRLLSAVTDHWGISPFSLCLRLYNGLGSLLASLTFLRARSTAQLAILGTLQGKRWFDQLRRERDSEEKLERLSNLGLDETLLREAEIVISGHASEALFEKSLFRQQSLEQLRREAAVVENQFVLDAGQKVDQSIEALAQRNSRFWIRGWYEVLFLAYLLFVLYRVGKNFFYESLILDESFLSTDFYLAAGLFLLLWSALLVMAFTRRLRRGVQGEVTRLISELVEQKLRPGLFPHLEQGLRETELWIDEGRKLLRDVNRIRDQLAAPIQS